MFSTCTTLIAETVRNQYEKIDSLILNVKKVFLKAPLRVKVYKKSLGYLPLPPKPVLTRWRAWLQAAIFHCEHLEDNQKVVMKFDNNTAKPIETAQKPYKLPEIKKGLVYKKRILLYLQKI
ncbi:hypothetical protein ILUMI_15271 [Ignelater luminosus]|uniref:Uncharacterized protein n=1 Tax=Ignelater luminosus TaxID=2038154 RepID=A0A8K0CV06_IGNLU|nr:hypothetical protein ILUMI_15271 [Ignelater luminosus]